MKSKKQNPDYRSMQCTLMQDPNLILITHLDYCSSLLKRPGAGPGAGKGRGTNRLSCIGGWGEHILLLVAVFLSSNDHSLVG